MRTAKDIILDYAILRRNMGIPDVLSEFVLKVGQEFHGKHYDGKRKKAKECFRNATILATDQNIDYIEGLAIIPKIGFPMHHAWCAVGDEIIDPTWKDPENCLYFGVRFTSKEVWDRIVVTELYGLLANHITFELDFMDSICPGFKDYILNFRKEKNERIRIIR